MGAVLGAVLDAVPGGFLEAVSDGFLGAVLGAFDRGVISRSRPYPRSLFCAPSAFENPFGTTGACFLHRISLPYRRSLFFTPNASEDASRTPEALFLAPNAYSVHQESLSGTEYNARK